MARNPFPPSTLDRVLTIQLAVAWAGETGDPPRLAWWRTDMVSEFGGQDLFERLLPRTWAWASLQAAREAARRVDAAVRSRHHAPDTLLSLFHLGADLDTRVDERLAEHKRSELPPTRALPGLAEVITEAFHADAFRAWAAANGQPQWSVTPAGRQLQGAPPAALERRIANLAAALAEPATAWPSPHYRTPA